MDMASELFTFTFTFTADVQGAGRDRTEAPEETARKCQKRPHGSAGRDSTEAISRGTSMRAGCSA